MLVVSRNVVRLNICTPSHLAPVEVEACGICFAPRSRSNARNDADHKLFAALFTSQHSISMSPTQPPLWKWQYHKKSHPLIQLVPWTRPTRKQAVLSLMLLAPFAEERTGTHKRASFSCRVRTRTRRLFTSAVSAFWRRRWGMTTTNWPQFSITLRGCIGSK